MMRLHEKKFPDLAFSERNMSKDSTFTTDAVLVDFR